MTGRVRHLLRTLVLRTNSYFPFRYSNRWPYYAALKAVVRTFRKHDGVLAIYLGRTLTSDAWVPGLSDVDLTLILKRGLSTNAEFDLTEALWSGYYRLTRYFPFLGELLILGADDLNPWLRASCEAPAPRTWTLLAGEDVYDPAADNSPDWRRRCLDFAMWVHLDLIPPCLALPDSFLSREDMRRRVRKIFRVLKPVLREEPVIEEADRFLLAAQGAVAIERAAAGMEPGGGDDRDPAPQLCGGCGFQQPGVLSAMRFRESVLLVMENGSPAQAIAAAMTEAGRHWNLPPATVSRSVLRYMLRTYDPYSYKEFEREREVLYGTDPLDIAAPGSRDIAAYLLAHLDHTLAFPRSEWFFPASGFPSSDELQIAFGRIMAARLLVEKNWTSPVRRDVDVEARREYPECAQALEEIGHLFRSEPAAARRKAFGLFLALTQIVREGAAHKSLT